MGNNQTSFFIINQKFGQMLNPVFIQIVRWLIQKQNIWILYKGRSYKKSCLLTARKRFYYFVFWCMKINHFQNFIYSQVNVVNCFLETILEKLLDRQTHFCPWDDLPCDGNG